MCAGGVWLCYELVAMGLCTVGMGVGFEVWPVAMHVAIGCVLCDVDMSLWLWGCWWFRVVARAYGAMLGVGVRLR